jgi:type VI secretion system protein ImpH
MATPRRQPDTPLIDLLFEESYRFDFFQLVRLLGRLDPSRRPVGRVATPESEVVRFITEPTLAFVPTPVRELKKPLENGRPPELTSAALSLTGPTGALPYCYTELLVDRAREDDESLAAFLDLFHHRLLSLFYRAWEKHRPALALERAWDERQTSRNGRPEVQDPFSDHLFALIGLGLRPLRGRHDFPDKALLYYVGLFAQQHRSAVALEAMLREFFGLPIEVVQFVEHWLRLDPLDRSTLSGSGSNNGLGVDLIMGDRVRDVAGKFRLRIGPLSLDQFRRLSPEQELFRRLVQMTRLFIDAPLVFDIQLVLESRAVPDCQLSSKPGPGTTLGRDTWVKSLGLGKDVGDAVYPSES